MVSESHSFDAALTDESMLGLLCSSWVDLDRLHHAARVGADAEEALLRVGLIEKFKFDQAGLGCALLGVLRRQLGQQFLHFGLCRADRLFAGQLAIDEDPYRESHRKAFLLVCLMAVRISCRLRRG